MSDSHHGWFTPEEKMKYIQDYLESGLSMRQYVLTQDLKLSTFTRWVRTYNAAMTVPTSGFQDVTPILKPKEDYPVAPLEQDPRIHNIKMILPSGITLEFELSLLHGVMEELK